MLAYGHQLSAEAAVPKALLQGGYVHCETERVKRRVTEFFFFGGGGGNWRPVLDILMKHYLGCSIISSQNKL